MRSRWHPDAPTFTYTIEEDDMSKMGAYVLELQTQQENAEYVHSRATSNIGHRDQPSMGHYLVRSGAIPQWGDDYVQHSSGAAPSTERRGLCDGPQPDRVRPADLEEGLGF